MAGKIFGVIYTFSLICSIFTHNTDALTPAIFEGASRALELTFALVSMMCLYSGVLEVFRDAGVIEKGANLLSPVLRFLFPCASKTGRGINECAASIAANILGIGNAATPFALAAIKEMSLDNKNNDSASDDMITLAILNSAPITIMPITLITLRTMQKSAYPDKIVIPIWIASTLGSLIAIMSVKLFGALYKRKGDRACRR